MKHKFPLSLLAPILPCKGKTVLGGMTMNKKFLLPAIALLAAYSVQSASAIGLVFDHIQFASFVNGVSSVQVVSGPTYLSETHGPDGQPYANINWQSSNSPDSASLQGQFSLSHVGSAVPDNTLINALVFFTLSEPVNYSLTRSLFKSFDGGIDSLSSGIGSLPFPGTDFGTGVNTSEFGQVTLPPITGTFAPGQYFFNTYAQSLSGGQSSSTISLSFTRISSDDDHDHGHGHGNHVPDGGSTLAMLGTALLGIALVRHRATASPC